MKHWIKVVLCCMFMSGKIIAVEPVDADILLQGGTIFDGSGGQPYVGDVAISGDRLIAIGSFESGQFGRVIDCKGLSICPGFIDLHNHSDQTLLESSTRANTNFVLQGCTTIVTGNCGSGHVDVRKYLNQIETFGAGTNVIHLLPHGALRKQVLGTTDRPPTAKEMQQMKQLAGEAMEAGTAGMSLRPVSKDRKALEQSAKSIDFGDDIDGIGGFVLESKDGSVVIDYRFEGRLRTAWETSLGDVSTILFGE